MALGETIREFGVKISLAFDKKKFDEAQSGVEKFASKMKNFAFDLTALTAGLFETQNLFTSNARALEDQAATLGITTDALQEYEYAAKIGANVNREELVTSFEKLADTMDQAKAGMPEATQAIYQIGEAIQKGYGQDLLTKVQTGTVKVTDVFHDLSGAIQNISKTSPQGAQRLAEFALGNAKLIPLLREGPKALDNYLNEAKKNFVQNEAQLRQGKLMDQQMSRLWLIMRKFGYEIGYNVMTKLGPMINQFIKWFGANKRLISTGIVEFLKELAIALQGVWKFATETVTRLGPLVDKLGGAQKAAQLLIEAFVAWKALSLAASFASMVTSIAGLFGPVATATKALYGMLTAQEAVTAAQAAGALSSQGALAATEGMAVATAATAASWTSILGSIAAVAAAGAAGFGVGTLINKGLDKMIGPEGLGGKIFDWTHPGLLPETVKPSGGPGAAGFVGPPAPPQENHFHTQNNISIPHGTSAAQAASIVSKAQVDSNEQLLKALAESARSRNY